MKPRSEWPKPICPVCKKTFVIQPAVYRYRLKKAKNKTVCRSRACIWKLQHDERKANWIKLLKETGKI